MEVKIAVIVLVTSVLLLALWYGVKTFILNERLRLYMGAVYALMNVGKVGNVEDELDIDIIDSSVVWLDSFEINVSYKNGRADIPTLLEACNIALENTKHLDSYDVLIEDAGGSVMISGEKIKSK